MYIILSPAKNMKFEDTNIKAKNLPLLAEKSFPLVDFIVQKDPIEIGNLMKIKDGTSLEVWRMYQEFSRSAWELIDQPALLTYDGLVFKYLNQQPWNEDSFKYACHHLGILSGLMGLVRPDDKILPYRLEMQTKINYQGLNLYEYWKDDIYQEVMKIKKTDELIVNLASKEYSKCITDYLFDSSLMINIEFKVYRQGKFKVLGTFAKMARGLMARYIIENRITQIEDLFNFDGLGHRYRADLSTQNNLVFVKVD